MSGVIYLVFEILVFVILAAVLGYTLGWLSRGGVVRRLRRGERDLKAKVEALEAELAIAQPESATAAETSESEAKAPTAKSPETAVPETAVTAAQAPPAAAPPASDAAVPPPAPALTLKERRRRRARRKRRGTRAPMAARRVAPHVAKRRRTLRARRRGRSS